MNNQISPHAVVQSDQIGRNVRIHEFAVIRAGARIGNGVVVHSHVVIESDVVLEDGVEVFPGAYLGKEPKGPGVLARQPIFTRRLTVGANSLIGPHSIIYFDVDIGESCLIGDGASIREQTQIGNKTIIGRYVTVNYNTRIGDNVKIMDHSWLAGNMTIGDRVFISGGVFTANDNSIGLTTEYHEEQIIGPTIEADAAVGANAILLPRVTIGQGAIVGAGSVVSRDVDPKTVVMGVPARLVRRLEE